MVSGGGINPFGRNYSFATSHSDCRIAGVEPFWVALWKLSTSGKTGQKSGTRFVCKCSDSHHMKRMGSEICS